MSTDKKDIYAGSYEVVPDQNKINANIEKIRQRKTMSERRKIGLLLKEEKSKSVKLQMRNRHLEEENRRLKEAIALNARNAAAHQSR